MLQTDEKGRFELYCNGEGVLFVSPELRQLIPAVDYSADCDLCQVWGSVSWCGVTPYSCRWNLSSPFHQCMVRHGTWHTSEDPTFLDRTLLRGRDPPIPAFDHTENYSPSSSTLRPPPKTTSTAILRITADQLAILKTKLKGEKDQKRYSTYEAMAAHLWRSACMVRGLPDDQDTKLYITTDGRSRLILPPGYFGNVLFTTTSTAPSGEIQSQPFRSTVDRNHNALSRMCDDYLRSALDYLELQPDPTALIRGAHTFNSPNLNSQLD
ncbi:unnamed protein product [Ilex paraguariensis]|uniref:Uncharacterized protein n=1 Tax=Ilex paraguariensis TaxID=185542 RepID=A0ABC8THE2_9AQUA